jgi:hypothetical protein
MDHPTDEKSRGDVVFAATKGLISSIPIAGGALTVLLENVFTAPLDRRRQEWLRRLAEVVTALEQKVEGLTADKLSDNEMFVTAALQATQIALRTHHQEKLEALRNAVFNAGLPNSPSDHLQLTFLRLIDELTPWHLRLLALLDDPVQWMERNNVNNPRWGMGGPLTVIEHCFPELRRQDALAEQLVRDLQTAGLVLQGSFLKTTMTGSGMVQSRTTPLAKAFLASITQT